jgi:hypothetical protein
LNSFVVAAATIQSNAYAPTVAQYRGAGRVHARTCAALQRACCVRSFGVGVGFSHSACDDCTSAEFTATYVDGEDRRGASPPTRT